MGFLRKEQVSEDTKVFLHPCSTPPFYESGDARGVRPLFDKGSVWQCDECGKIWVAEWDRFNDKRLTWERPYALEEWLIRRKLKR